MKFTLQQTQVALVYQIPFIGSFDGILSSYQATYPITKGEKIPIPDDFPEDSIPRLEIQHPDKKIIVRFAKSRADIFFNSGTVNEVILTDLIQRVIDSGVIVGRIGYVQKTIYSDVDIKYIRERLPMLEVVMNDDEITEAAQRLNKKTIIDSNGKRFACNNIAALTLGKKDNKPALLLQRDVNTKQDENLTLKDADGVQGVIKLLKAKCEESIFRM